MAQQGAPGRVLAAPPELLPSPSACWGALIGLPQRCGPRPGCAGALQVLHWPRVHVSGLPSTGHPHHTSSSAPLAPPWTTPSPPRSEVQLSVWLGGSPPALFIVVVADPAHGAPSARPPHTATGHSPLATGYRSFSSVPPLHLPPATGASAPCHRSALAMRLMAMAFISLQTQGGSGCGCPAPPRQQPRVCWQSALFTRVNRQGEERAVFTQCLCPNVSPCTSKGTNTD